MIKFARRTVAPAAPAAGLVRLFADAAGAMQVQDSAGALTELGAGGAPGATSWGDIDGVLGEQADLAAALAGKEASGAAAAAIVAHNAAGDPHPGYTTAAELSGAISAHEGAGDPHPGYSTTAELEAAVGALAAPTSGTTTVDFGAFPGSSDASVSITGQTGIVAGSKVKAFLMASATADHSADEHWLETISVMAGDITEGVGFVIYARNTGQINEPVATQAELTRQHGPGVGRNQPRPEVSGGMGTRLYGQFTVAWEWI